MLMVPANRTLGQAKLIYWSNAADYIRTDLVLPRFYIFLSSCTLLIYYVLVDWGASLK